MAKVKVGTVLYRVYDKMGTLEMQSVTVTRVTTAFVFFADAKRQWAFNYSTRLDRDKAAACAQTPVDAAAIYAAECSTDVEKAQEALNHQHTRLSRARDYLRIFVGVA